jgi:SnoaL-like domain
MMTDVGTAVDQVVDGYFAMWNETDPARRRAAIDTAWTPEASYLDPMLSAEGYAELDPMVTQVQDRFPGHRFRLTGPVDSHHDRLRWDWELAGPDGAPAVVSGVDFAVLAVDGRLREVTGFFESTKGGA